MSDLDPQGADPAHDGGPPAHAEAAGVASPEGAAESMADAVAAAGVSDAADQPPPPSGEPIAELNEEAVVALIAERDEYLDALQRIKAEFANHRRRSAEQATAQREQAAGDLVTRLLPVLDSATAALDQGVEQARPLIEALFEALTSQGLTTVDPVGEPFDPEFHEAVLFESADDGDGEQTVAETMRPGYSWNGRVLRAAMVKVRG